MLQPAAAHQRLGEPVLEQGAVGQAGQAVIEGLVHQLLLEALALVHVVNGADDAGDGRVGQQVGQDELDIAPVPVPVADAQLGLAGAAIRPAHLVPELARSRLVLGMDQRQEGTAEQLVRPVAPRRLGGRALILHRPEPWQISTRSDAFWIEGLQAPLALADAAGLAGQRVLRLGLESAQGRPEEQDEPQPECEDERRRDEDPGLQHCERMQLPHGLAVMHGGGFHDAGLDGVEGGVALGVVDPIIRAG